jgi:hypothetical protein
MTFTTAVWICLVAAAGTSVVRALRTRPARRLVRETPAREDDDGWHPHVSSGCGR